MMTIIIRLTNGQYDHIDQFDNLVKKTNLKDLVKWSIRLTNGQ